MKPVEVEEPLGVWTRHMLTPEARRALMLLTPAYRRFVDPEGVVYLAHPLNLWCALSEITL